MLLARIGAISTAPQNLGLGPLVPAGEEGFFILAGQSNAEGHTANPGFNYDFLRTTIYRKTTGHTTNTDDGSFVDLVFGNNNSLDTADNEADVGVEIAKLFEDNDPASLRVVKVAIGATGFDGGTGSWARGGVLREALINRYLRRAIPDAVTAGDQVNILPVLWIQGENEATNSTWAAAYQANLAEFIADVRGATGMPTLPFVIVKLHDDINTTLHPHAATVQTAQAAVATADANVYLLNPSAIADYDGEHYGVAGFEELAQLYYDLAATIGATPYTLNTDAAAFVARLGGSYTDRERHAINSFVATTDLRTIAAGGSQWDNCQAIWVRALDTAADSRLNLKGASYSLVDNNSPTFTANQGMQYNGSSQYTMTGINPATINSSSAAGMIGVYLRQNDSDTGYWMTAFDNTIATVLQNDINGNGRFFGFMNRTSGLVTLSGASNEQGSISVYRGASTTAGVVQNQRTEATSTMTGSAVVSAEISLMAFTTNGGTPELYSANQLGAAWASIGVAWTATEVRLFHAEIQQVLTVFGAAV